ncbi:EscU/YscU/HrcU family type III secretion system export apparatus switch protein [Photobacterium galatheae]|uniref:Flagellar biosynthesis protein FlhB n=1 Tax=Photobacterium galatheae TaxID=1654360 RepID=A0A066S0B5_9GAMM|nr:EscU/YscU/HrcU family type III secretion system export apparatus switch protein [Photobacterium galatheae]KDM93078.1 flagellar biosynthesis protein FlhB [Photobacterium galatheae]MCM0148393.1 EscU/YscU/HrcU family type III secretion system export apparatus switch protein [Photobacterium galatheae]
MNKKQNSAIALSYDGYETPYVAAKGYDDWAKDIIEQVKAQGGLIHQDPVLAEYLNRLEVGDDIPPALFVVIAELIAFSWVLNGKTPPGWEGYQPVNETA